MEQMNDLKLLGLKVADKVTGFTGVVDSICYDLYGCIQATVKPPCNEKGEYLDAKWFDVARLQVLSPTPVMEVPGARFAVARDGQIPQVTNTHGAADKPAR
jgi:hypothetical protein